MANGTPPTAPTPPLLSRPAVPPPIRTRQNIYTLLSLSPNHPVITFYGRAITEMKQGNRIDLPSSWRYQAAIHDYPLPDSSVAERLNNRANPDPSASSSDVLPGDRTTFWRQCQHAGWFFLPWHRMYLHHFEKIIMRIVARLGGPSDWALPYWNYSRSGQDILPPPLRDPSSPLFVSERTPDANLGRTFLRPSDVSLNCLTETLFTPAAVNSGFGGTQRANHPPAGVGKGAVEQAPHDQVHNRVGGGRGFMSLFSTAPLDPVFWLHHCNIDRLWEVWIRRGNTNPTAADWLTSTSFPFHDATGAVVNMTSSQVVDTKASPLSYIYDDYT